MYLWQRFIFFRVEAITCSALLLAAAIQPLLKRYSLALSRVQHENQSSG
jgi:hypothetical protein